VRHVVDLAVQQNADLAQFRVPQRAEKSGWAIIRDRRAAGATVVVEADPEWHIKTATGINAQYAESALL